MGLHNCNEDTLWQGELLLQEVRHEQEITLGGDYRSQDWVCEPGNLGPGWGIRSTPQKSQTLYMATKGLYGVRTKAQKIWVFSYCFYSNFSEQSRTLNHT